MSRTRRSAWNLASTYALSLVALLTGLVATPLVLRGIGEERFGALRMLSEWAGYIALLELGVSGAAQPLLASAINRGGSGELGLVVAVIGRAYRRLVVPMAAAWLGLTVAAPYLIPVRGELVGELIFAVALSSLSVALLPLGVFRWLADAGQRGYLVSATLTTQAVVVAVLSVGAAAAGWGLPGQAGATLVGAALSHLGLAWVGKRRHPEVAGDLGRTGHPEQELKLVSLSRPALVFNVCARLSVYSDSLILALLLGPASVVPFYLTQRLPILVGGYVTAIGNATWAGLAELHHQGHREVLCGRAIQITRITGVVAGAIVVPTVVVNSYFVGLWVGADRYGGDALTLLTAVFVWAQGLICIWGWLVHGTGHLPLMIPCVAAGAAINLAVSVVGTWWLGAIGPAVGSAVQYGLVMSVWLPLILRQLFGIPLRELAAAAVWPLVTGVLYGVGLLAVSRVVPPYQPDWTKWVCWLSLGGWAAAAAIGYFAGAWFLLIPRQDRAAWQARFRSRRPRGLTQPHENVLPDNGEGAFAHR